MRIDIYHATAGYGHKKVAEVIGNAFLRRGLSPTEVTVEDSLDFTSDFFRWIYPATYYYAVRHFPFLWGWFYETFDHPHVYALVKHFRSFGNRLEGRELLKRVEEEKPDHIICTHFFTAELFAREKREGRVKANIIVVITDFLPHTFWLNEGTDFYWVMSEETKKEVVKRGIPHEKVIASGIPVDPIFQPTGRKKEILEKCGLKDDRFTILLTSGSFGLGPQEEILREMESLGDRIQCLVVCGNNHHLQKHLESKHFPYPVKVFGFIDFMADLMEASDLLIAKSGGSTSVESLTKGLPMVVLHPIPGQETRNADYLKRHNASFFIKHPPQIKLILKEILDHPEILDAKRRVIQDLAKPHAVEDLVTFVLKGEKYVIE